MAAAVGAGHVLDRRIVCWRCDTAASGRTIAALLGTLGYAVYITWAHAANAPRSRCVRLSWLVSLAAAFLPLAWFRSTWPVNAALLAFSDRRLRGVDLAHACDRHRDLAAARELLRSRPHHRGRRRPAAEACEGAAATEAAEDFSEARRVSPRRPRRDCFSGRLKRVNHAGRA